MPAPPDSSPWLRRLPGFQRSPAGLEWRLWKKMPAILAWGTLVPLAFGALVHVLWAGPHLTAAQERSLLLLDYLLVGLVVLHWTLVLTLAIGCAIVMVMKGPAYVADGYEVGDSDRPRP